MSRIHARLLPRPAATYVPLTFSRAGLHIAYAARTRKNIIRPRAQTRRRTGAPFFLNEVHFVNLRLHLRSLTLAQRQICHRCVQRRMALRDCRKAHAARAVLRQWRRMRRGADFQRSARKHLLLAFPGN